MSVLKFLVFDFMEVGIEVFLVDIVEFVCVIGCVYGVFV